MKSFEQGIKTNILLTVLLVLLVVLNLVFGSVSIPVSRLLRILLGEDEQLYHSMIVEADHTRSVRGIAAQALKDAAYSDNAYLKSLVSGTD